MDKVEFDKIKTSAASFKYSALEYTEYSDVANYSIEINSDALILLFGYNDESKIHEYIWAANRVNTLIDNLVYQNEYILSFVPKEWVLELKSVGLRIRNAWHDYFLYDLDKKELKKHSEYDFLKTSEIDYASKITIQCKGQSRGFTGQTSEWFNKWLNSHDIKDTAVLVNRAPDDSISALVCIGLYGGEGEGTPIVWIREAAVSPKHQNKGIGRILVSQALQYGRGKGAKKAFLAVDEDNKNAIRLYTSLGFAPSNDDSEITMIHQSRGCK